MKIGILTFHNAHNYGAVLQAYALKKYLCKCGCDAKIINYENDYIKKRYDYKLSADIHVKDIFYPRKLIRKMVFCFQIPFMKSCWEKKCDYFNEFITNELIADSDNVNELILNGFDTYNYIIVGSDQVWSSNLTGGLDTMYLLDFTTNAVKCSYGASVSRGVLRDDELPIFKRCLGEFMFISVRENTLKKCIEERLNYPTSVVVDPTLLIDKADYCELMSKDLCEREPFIFAYFIADDTEMSISAKRISKKMGYKLIELHYYNRNFEKKDNYLADIGPREFLWYFNNAELIVTNSFHGIVFSVIFQKTFYAIYNNDARKDNLLCELGLEKRHKKIFNLDEDIDGINYEIVEKNLDKIRRSSYQYLYGIVSLED